MLRIGLTGGTGFIGQAFIQEYGSTYDIVAASSQKNFSVFSKKAKYITIDYSKEAFIECFKDCDTVVHLGGYVMKGLDSIPDPTLYLPNIKLANDVFSSCVSLGIKNIVNASSMAVYDLNSKVPIPENSPLYPQSYYGITKIAIEKAAALFNRKYNLRIKSLRFSQGIGIRADRNDSRFWNIVLDNCCKGIPIPIWGEGKTGRDIIYVKDMAFAISCAIEASNACGEFNIGSGFISTNKEIAETYCKVFSNKAGLLFLPEKQEPGSSYCLDCSKAKNILGFSAKYDLIHMVEDIKEELKNCIVRSKEG